MRLSVYAPPHKPQPDGGVYLPADSTARVQEFLSIFEEAGDPDGFSAFLVLAGDGTSTMDYPHWHDLNATLRDLEFVFSEIPDPADSKLLAACRRLGGLPD